MALFQDYPIISYDNTAIRDLSIRVILRDAIKNNLDLYFLYDLQDMETPEDVAFDQYGDANRHWVILFMNDIIDPFYDWMLSRRELTRYIENKHGKPTIVNGEYQTDGFNQIHHWVHDDIYYYDAPDSGSSRAAPAASVPVTLFEHEDALNDAKRTIKVLYPEHIGHIERELKFAIDNGY
jgi:hypothetical protein